jgi:hypothetical protein
MPGSLRVPFEQCFSLSVIDERLAGVDAGL